MAYEKTNWKNGDVITAEKLNKIEAQIADNIIEFEMDFYQGVPVFDAKTATYRDVMNMFKSGKSPFGHFSGEIDGESVDITVSMLTFQILPNVGEISTYAIEMWSFLEYGEAMRYESVDLDSKIVWPRIE